MFASLEEYQKVREAVALENGFALYRQYGEAQAAGFLKVDLTTLKRWRRADHIPFVNLGERQIRYFGYQIADILILGKDKCLDIPSVIKSGTGSLDSGKAAQPTTAPATTQKPATPNFTALAQTALKSPKRG